MAAENSVGISAGERRQRIRRASAVRVIALVLLMICLVTGLEARPAAALTNNEKFVWAVHADFLLRAPNADEVTWWNAYLSGNSRTAMVTSLLHSSEFANLWAVGASLYYLDEIDPDTFNIADTLESSDDFVASEVTLIAGATYYANSGGTNTSFVEALYLDVLQRPVTAPILSYWVGRLNNGTSTRSSVASYAIKSNESARRRVGGTEGMISCPTTALEDASSLTAGSYCIVLDRVADSGGLSYWADRLSASDQLPTLWASLAGSTEYYNKALTKF